MSTGENNVVLQVSSGSSGKPVRVIPRSLDDIASIHAIVLSTWQKVYPTPPRRVALLGGISHGQAALKLRIAGTRFESFDLAERDRLMAFDPELVSCYPSIARELVADEHLELPSVKALKLGGERVFRSDIRKIQARFSGIPVIEQLGCTEMPAVAMGIYRRPEDPRRLVLQAHRFSFRLAPHADWQPLVVRDDFEGLLAPFPGFYDTGDEVRVSGDVITDVRRKGDHVHRYHRDLENLLERGCVNVQVDLDEKHLRYSGCVTLPQILRIADLRLYPIRLPPERLRPSNKLPLARRRSPR